MNAIILGAKSDIAQALRPMLMRDGWTLHGWRRGMTSIIAPEWELCIVALGVVAPVGLWSDKGFSFDNLESNLLIPLDLLHAIWPRRAPNAKVCFMAGSNPNSIMDGYFSYNVSKMALLKAVEQIDHEEKDATVFALGPGVTDTKIHNATKEAGWPNPRLERAMQDGSFTPMEKIYDTLKWCLAKPKESIGGRNICVSDLEKPGITSKLESHPHMFKLRRQE